MATHQPNAMIIGTVAILQNLMGQLERKGILGDADYGEMLGNIGNEIAERDDRREIRSFVEDVFGLSAKAHEDPSNDR